MEGGSVKVLLVEDDEDDFIVVRSYLADVSSPRFEIEWAATYSAALDALKCGSYDVCLLDYRLGEHDGLELLGNMAQSGCTAPIIFLTGSGDHSLDVEAMKAGACDYLAKDKIDAQSLERSIRYAIANKRAAEALEKRSKDLASLNKELQDEIEERKRAEEALRESERQLRYLSSQLLSAQEEERKRIARELHDSIGSSLSAIKFSLETAADQSQHGAISKESLLGLASTARRAIDDTRRIMTALRPSLLDDLGILATIGWHCRHFMDIYPDVCIEKEIGIEEENVPEPLKVVIFRIIQEAFHNIAKHSKAEHVRLTFRKGANSIELSIADDGKGFPLKASGLLRENNKGGLGLASMRERAELSGGIFAVESLQEQGTTVRAFWPLRCEAESNNGNSAAGC